MRKTTVSLFTAAIMILGIANPAAADSDRDDDDKQKGKIELLTKETAAVVAGDTVWVALNWTAKNGPISNVSVVLAEEPEYGVEVSYPTNTGSWTGLMDGHFLDVGEIDYTAIRVFVPDTFDKNRARVVLAVSYTNARGEAVTDRVNVRVPVVQYSDGEHVAQHESSAVVLEDESTWVDVDLTGLAPVVTDISMTASGDLAITYPGYGTSTSPYGDEVLLDGETDTARFRVDAGDAAPGTYKLATELSYTFEGADYVREGTVEITIS